MIGKLRKVPVGPKWKPGCEMWRWEDESRRCRHEIYSGITRFSVQ